MDVNCYVYQKHIDLHCVSALEAINRYMGATFCKNLKRYKHWKLKVDNVVDKNLFIKKISTDSYYLFNPNKEDYKLEIQTVNDSNLFQVFVDVESLLVNNNVELVSLLNMRYDVNILSIKENILWECYIEADSHDQAKMLVETQLLSNEHGSGILSNYLYEQASLALSYA